LEFRLVPPPLVDGFEAWEAGDARRKEFPLFRRRLRMVDFLKRVPQGDTLENYLDNLIPVEAKAHQT